MMPILEISDLSVEVEGEKIISGLKLKIKEGESHVLFGPNGSGKSTLLNAILGTPGYDVTSGKIIFNGSDITEKTVDERARLGLGFGFQVPPEVVGVKLLDMLKVCEGRGQKEELSREAQELVEKLEMDEYLHRDVNVGFSGGERKRAEVLQVLLMKPKLLLLDEPDSGVDVESLGLIAGEIQDYLKKNNASALIITHHGHILEHIRAENACVLVDRRIHCHGKPEIIFKNIKERGYIRCIECHDRTPDQDGAR